MTMAWRILRDSNQWLKESSFMTTTISFLWICLFNEQPERCTICIAILYWFRLRGPSRTYMTESLQSPYLPIILDTFSTHTHQYVTSILMLGFCMNPYATSFASSPLHGMYSYFNIFSQGTLRGKVLLPNMSEDHSL
jgi:hypothetical protein